MALRLFLHSLNGIYTAGESKKGDLASLSRCKEEGMAKHVRIEGSDNHSWMNGKIRDGSCVGFQMPLHYPRYKKDDYEKMEEWKVDLVLREYGLSFDGSLHEKRSYAMGTFMWPDQLSSP